MVMEERTPPKKVRYAFVNCEKPNYGFFKVIIFFLKILGAWQYDFERSVHKRCLKALFTMQITLLLLLFVGYNVNSVMEEIVENGHQQVRVALFAFNIFFCSMLWMVTYVHFIRNSKAISELLLKAVTITCNNRKSVSGSSYSIFVLILGTYTDNFYDLLQDRVFIFNHSTSKSNSAAYYGIFAIKMASGVLVNSVFFLYVFLYTGLTLHIGYQMSSLYAEVYSFYGTTIQSKEYIKNKISCYVDLCVLVTETNSVFGGMVVLWYAYFIVYFILMIPGTLGYIQLRGVTSAAALSLTHNCVHVVFFCVMTAVVSKTPDASENFRECIRQLIHNRITGNVEVDHLEADFTLKSVYLMTDHFQAGLLFRIRKHFIMRVSTVILFYVLIAKNVLT